jgi:hypothetical protein
MQECVSCMKVKRCCDCVDAYFRVAKSNMTFKELHRCNHLPKVQPSLKMDLLAQPCTSWTWALRASQSSKMKLKLEAHDTKHALVLPTLQTRLCFPSQEKREIEDYLALDLNFLNLLAGAKCLRTSEVENTSEKSHSPPWSRKCCRSRKKHDCVSCDWGWICFYL